MSRLLKWPMSTFMKLLFVWREGMSLQDVAETPRVGAHTCKQFNRDDKHLNYLTHPPMHLMCWQNWIKPLWHYTQQWWIWFATMPVQAHMSHTLTPWRERPQLDRLHCCLRNINGIQLDCETFHEQTFHLCDSYFWFIAGNWEACLGASEGMWVLGALCEPPETRTFVNNTELVNCVKETLWTSNNCCVIVLPKRDQSIGTAHTITFLKPIGIENHLLQTLCVIMGVPLLLASFCVMRCCSPRSVLCDMPVYVLSWRIGDRACKRYNVTAV